MINLKLSLFVDNIAKTGIITDDNVRLLCRDLLPDGILVREEADLLIALDRAAKPASQRWDDFLVASVVEYVVWDSRPTGRVDSNKTRWLLESLKAGSGPTVRAVRIAFEVVREADHVSEELTTFVMRADRDRKARAVHAQRY
jgi:hypothetical protein